MNDIPSNVLALLDRVTAENVRFIKLGRKSVWWPLAKDTNTLRLGFREFDFALCKNGKWDDARKEFVKTSSRTRPSDITRAVNQVRDFFELPETILWCTIEDGDLWWCFAEAEIIDLYHGDDEAETKIGARMRRVIDRWRNTDINGERLRLDSMTTKVTKVASFQETIAKPSGASDLLRRIRRIQSDHHVRAARALDEMVSAIGNLLDQLHQTDFELLIELIFSSSGWKRISAVGGTQKTLDLALILPTTGEYCFVQVKSQTNRSTFRSVVESLNNPQGYSRLFFAYHTPVEVFDNNESDRVTVWHRYEIARQAIRAGLVDWILSRTT
jgi:hypothetical protein